MEKPKFSGYPAESVEEKLISRIFGFLKRYKIDSGLGDDASVFSRPGMKTAVSADSFVEGTHFNRLVPPDSVGFRSAAGAASDIFAMGAEPAYLIISLGIPPETEHARVMKIYEGIARFCRQRNVKVAGGDVVRSRVLFISVCALGFAGKFVTRSGAKPGDVVFITGSPGLSSAGLELLKKGVRRGRAVKKFLYPDIYSGDIASLAGSSSSMLDSSDGLVASCRLMAAASGVRMDLDTGKIPLDRALIKACGGRKKALASALEGGEDYYLVCASAPGKFAGIKNEVFEVGRVSKGKGVFIDGRRASFMGFRHFG